MIRPTRRAVLLLAAGIPVALVPALVEPRLWGTWLGYLFLAVVAIGLDAILLPPERRLAVETRAPKTLYAGDEGSLTVVLDAPGFDRAARVEALCDLDPALLAPQPATEHEPIPGRPVEVRVALVPRRRGVARLGALWLRLTGRLGLVERIVRRPLDHEVAIVPNVGAVRAAALRLFGAPEHARGIKVERYLGDGTEFESLREFVPGYESRFLDWKASARHVKLIVREHRAERNHQVILAFDTGRLMGEPAAGALHASRSAQAAGAGLPKLDHAINAGLILAYVALKTGDRVGLCAFDAAPGAYVEPWGGVRAFRRLQQATADFEYGTAETNFTLGIGALAARLRRRSLVVVFTDFVDTVGAELMVENMDRLARRHLVLFVALRDASLGAVARAEPRSLADLHRAVVASDLERERALVLNRLRSAGIHCVDAEPRQVSTPLLNRYLEIRRRELV